MTPLSAIAGSPLARHPGLLLRKVADRLRLRAPALPIVPDRLAPARYPASWHEALARGALPPRPYPDLPPVPFHRVFEQDFDEAQLLDRCRSGPARGVTGLPGDIKLIWDYSRGHALWPNVILGHVDAAAAFLERWWAAANGGNGPAWSCPMDVAIRAVNWIFADVMAHGELARRVGAAEWSRRLWRHGALVWQRLETNLVCSNHYLADLLGLAVIGRALPDDAEARRWAAFAQSEFPRALLAQTRPDGGLNEASTRYHAFVTEMALLTRLAVSEPFPQPAEERLRRMCQILADLRDADGQVFPFGDDDSGHVLALNWAGGGRGDAQRRLAAGVLGERFSARADAVYPDSGWWVRRGEEFTVAVEFGGVGLAGLGGHAHNDDLSFCLEWRNRPVVVDPGTYLYTSDLKARDEFRSARAHNSVLVDDLEPRAMGPGPFRLPGADRAHPIHATPRSTSFHRPVRAGGQTVQHRRTVELAGAELTIEDALAGTGDHRLEWRFHLHQGLGAAVNDGRIRVEVPGAGTLELEPPPGVQTTIETGRCADGYGRAHSIPVIIGRRRSALPITGQWQWRPLD